MTRFLFLLALLIGCKKLDHFPEGMGPGGGFPSNGDASAAYLDAGYVDNEITGKVCLISSLTTRDSCIPITNAALRITAGSEETTTASDGTFALPSPPTGDQAIVRSDPTSTYYGSTSVATLNANQAAAIDIPIVSNNTLDDILVASGALVTPGNAVVVLQLEDEMESPLSDATAGNIGSNLPYYATFDSEVFTLASATDKSGTIAFFNLAPFAGEYMVEAHPGRRRNDECTFCRFGQRAHRRFSHAQLSNRRQAAAFSSVSSHSRRAVESATIPPPT